MSAKNLKVMHANNIIFIIWVIIIQVFKYAKFDSSLMLKTLFISDYLYCDDLLWFVIEAL